MEKDFPGFSVGKKEDKLGIRASSTCELILEDCKVPQANLLGEVGKGYKIAIETLNEGRIGIGAQMLGVARGAWEHAVKYAHERKQFGKPIGVYQAVSHQLANTYADVELARSLTYWAAWCVAEDDPQAELAAAAAESAAGEAAVAACERSIQVHGGTGFTWEHALHRFYKRAQWIDGFAGSAAQQRRAVAAALLD